jgi:hypothetical protein
MITTTDVKERGHFVARSASGYVGCVHKHRTEAAARKCADGIHHTARVVFIATKKSKS